jgi:uncharacterized protein (TIGR00255 family)
VVKSFENKTMAIRSMTGYARVTGKVEGGRAFTLSLKSVNHRFLDLQFRLPSESDGLEMKLRRVLKEKMTRGHVDVTVSLDRAGEDGAAVELMVNMEIVGGYVHAFRAAAKEFGLSGDPDLNAILRVPGAVEAVAPRVGEALDDAVLACIPEALERLNAMREEEGLATARELRDRMERLRKAVKEVGKHRTGVQKAYADRLQARLQELIGAQADPARVLQEVALLADRSDIQEELVRLENHVDHFLGLLDAGGEAGKQLDFLLQEMNREANTMLSKTSGLAGEAMKITEIGLVVKSEIEKSKEQVQNLE